jgi:hypothetical protein
VTTLAVWSEREYRPPPNAGWHDCWVSARLQELAAAGYAFGAAAFTDAEREAAERAQTLVAPEGPGTFEAGDQFLARRYQLTDHRATDLAALLRIPALAIAAIGVNARLPARLRKWDPAFAGDHMATVITRAPGVEPTFLDPEAPMRYAGDPITYAELLAWWNRGQVRYLAVGELEVPPVWTAHITPIDLLVTVPAGTPILTGPGVPASFATTGVNVLHVFGKVVDGALTFYVYALGAGGLRVFDAKRASSTASPSTAAVAAALKARDLAWRTAIAKVSP